ncbi:hypothetical protein ASG39_08080 [Rhizobium sp. Leaf371]|uniref:hypothetical protein n=1 Tax=Rhizobium sp. Leaf371 TaxID=1736355 RepID=UPI0007144793|nr:hypothetical protein [Rhizobium sp. Leaf371]KQS65206.1 hypothetical protein ASG39_08080 [Rhizobium sp. Leaf371]
MSNPVPIRRLTPQGLPLAVVALLIGVTPALSQAPAPGRYSMQKTDTGIARLDTQTGEVTLCQEKAGDLVCRMAADERTAYDLELDLLEKRVETLEKAVKDAPEGFSPRLPTQEEIDQTMGIMDRMLRSFMGIARDFGREWQGEEKTPPAPDPDGDLRKT